MRTLPLIIACMLGAACDGPRENAGEQADFDNGVVNSEDSLRSGPAEDLGEIQDRAAAAAERARDAKADALEAAADERRQEADQQARALEEQADEVRGR